MIPRRVFHIWLSDQPETQLQQYCVRSWDRLGYEVVPITLESPECADPAVSALLKQGKIGRVKANDYLRVKLLLERGGWYMDNDVEVLRPFDSLADSGCVFAAESREQVNFAVLGAQAGSPFLAEVLDLMRQRVDEPNPVKFSLFAATEVARRHGWNGGDFQRDGLRILPAKAFYPYSWNEPYSPAKITPESYAVHYWGHSWGGPLVSIVIPCYQQGRYLAEAIESVLAQSWGHKEVIVVNDGSTDNTSEVARRYPVRLIEQPNRGLPAARNTGIREAAGEYILCLDADDRLAPKCIERCVGRADIICPGQKEFEGGSRFYARMGYDYSLAEFLRHNRIHCASLFRRSLWEQVGGFDESMTLGLEDWEFWIRLVAAGATVAPVDEPLFFYRVHKSMTASTTKPRFHEIVAGMKQKHAELYRRCHLA